MTETIHGAPSWHIGTADVDAWVTVAGAQLAPVEFRHGDRVARPYSLAPWLPDERANDPALLDALRGDFLCLPFGPQPDGPPHGEAANRSWDLRSIDDTSLTVAIDADDIGAHIERTVSLRPGQAAVYQHTRISGLDGAFSYGMHPILDFSSLPIGCARIGTSPMRWCSVSPGLFSDPARGEHQILSGGAVFDRLSAVPLADGGTLDLTRYPTPPGHEDLVMLVKDPAAGPVAWIAVTMDDVVWVTFTSVTDFPATVLWISNGGRSQPPWSSRHLARMGIEDVCSYFAEGLLPSRADHLQSLGIPTTRTFTSQAPVDLLVVHAVAFTPPGFGVVTDIEMSTLGTAVLCDDAGHRVAIAVDWQDVIDGGRT
jgi:hypothetical protein